MFNMSMRFGNGNELINSFNEKAKRAQLKFGQIAFEDMQDYVPMDTGDLRMSGRVESQGKKVVWESYSSRGYPYGLRQFTTQFSNYTTPGTGPRWDLRAAGLHMSEWENELRGDFE